MHTPLWVILVLVVLPYPVLPYVLLTTYSYNLSERALNHTNRPCPPLLCPYQVHTCFFLLLIDVLPTTYDLRLTTYDLRPDIAAPTYNFRLTPYHCR